MVTRSGRELDAQLGQNTNCVDCGRIPWHGGMRCWTCFKRRVDQRAATAEHEYDQPPSLTTYKKGCRCRSCRRVVARDQQKRRSS